MRNGGLRIMDGITPMTTPNERCQRCNGTKRVTIHLCGTHDIACPVCHGTGQAPTSEQSEAMKGGDETCTPQPLGEKKSPAQAGSNAAATSDPLLAATWQPISTAPKDRTAILLHAIGADQRPMIVIARWACSAEGHLFSSVRVCGTGKRGPCNYEWLGEMGTRYGVPFTHWMPLPKPPTP